MTHSKDSRAVIAALMATTALSGPAFAQVSQQAGETESSGEDEIRAFDTVVVTSQKRAQNIQDVPVAVSAVTDSMLEDAGAKDLADYARLVPGMVVTPSQFNGAGTPLLRGIASSAGEATVGYYLDDSPMQVRTTLFSSGADLKLFDISRIEVLRGPQGTLYGSGSMGGTIRLITEQPSLSSASGKLRAEVSSIDGGSMNYEFGAAAGGPLIEDVLGYRVSAFYSQQGGWVDQVSRTSSAVLEENINERESFALKGALLYQPTDRLELIPSVFYQSTEADDQAQFQSNLPGYQVQTTSPQPVDDDFTLAALTLNYDFGPATLTSITSYFDREVNQSSDYSMFISSALTGMPIFPGYENFRSNSVLSNTQKILTQEVRLASNGETRLDYVLGAFYMNDEQQRIQQVVDPELDDLFAFATGGLDIEALLGPRLPGEVSFYGDTKTERDAYAVFGEASYGITDRLRIRAGLRYEQSELDLNRLTDGPLNGGQIIVTGTQSEAPTTGKLGLEYDLTEDNFLYISAAQGFRTGGVNNIVPVTSCADDLAAAGRAEAPETFDSDKLTSYEIGTKNTFANGRVTLNAAAFRIDWTDLQQEIFLATCGFFFTENVGEARSEGIEIELTATPIEPLTITANLGHFNARLNSKTQGGIAPATNEPVLIGKSGDPIVGSPDWTVALAGEYRFALPVKTEGEGFLRVDYQYVGSRARTPPEGRVGHNPSIFRAKEYDIFSARLGARLDSGLDVAVFVNNIANRQPKIGQFSFEPTNTVLPTTSLMPRTIGVTVGKQF